MELDYQREKKERAEKLATDFEDLVNGQMDVEAFLSKFSRAHRTLQQSMFGVIVKLIIMMSKDDYGTDARNEQSKKMAKDFIKGYSEVYRQNEIEIYKRIGYTEEEAIVKAEGSVKRFLENPGNYMALGFI